MAGHAVAGAGAAGRGMARNSNSPTLVNAPRFHSFLFAAEGRANVVHSLVGGEAAGGAEFIRADRLASAVAEPAAVSRPRTPER